MKKLYTLISLLFIFSFQNSSAQIIGDTSVCAGEIVKYYISPTIGAGYAWNVTGGNVLGSPSMDSVTINWGNSGVGIITLSQINPVANYFLNITIHPNPNPQITHTPYPTCPSDTGHGSLGGQPDRGPECEKVCKFSTVIYCTAPNVGSTYQWFINGALNVTGASTNCATVTWDSTGTGTLLVIETNQWGCVDSAELCVEKVDLPVANFSHQTNVCKFSSVLFTNLSSGATSYQWNFGDGGTSAQTHPTHSYSNAGTYTITLIAFNDCFCSDTFQSVINVDSLPGPTITCPSTLCAFDTATYSTPSATGCIYTWFAIGGTIVSGQGTPNVTVAWGAGQLGTLGLVVTGCVGTCSDTTKVYIPIVPSVAVISGPNKVCPGDCHTYSLPRFSGATYTWSLNNGSCGTLGDSTCCEEVEICWPNIPQACADTLTVSFYDSFLHCGGTGQLIIYVRPELSIIGNTPVCANAISFFGNFPGVNCFWNISPAGPVLSPSPSPNVSVNWGGMTGTFLLTAAPQNPNQVCNDSAFIFVKVIAPPPAPVITGDTIVCPNSSVSYCTTPTTSTVNWIITGGTPTTSIGNCVTVTWGNTPPFIVQAYTQMPGSPYCSSDTTTQNVFMFAGAPPALNGSLIGCANGTSNYSTSTLYPAGSTYTWSISPPNAGAVTSGQGTTAIQIQWGNNAPQTVAVTLTVNACGQPYTNSINVTLNPPPIVTVTQLVSLCAGGNAQLQATGGGTYQWSGPGGYTSVTNPATIFLNGLYQVTVTGANTCTAHSQINVQYVSGPTASISTADYLSYCIGATYSVNICALGNANYTYAWNVGGPTTQCRSFNAPGSYSVIVTDITNNCTALSNTIVVTEDSCNGSGPGSCTPNGIVDFTHTSCNPISFTNTSVNAFNFTWYFGDLTASNLTSPTHSYSQAGFYLVTLTGLVPDINGIDTCVVSDTAHIEIPLAAKFDVSTGCWNDSVCFNDISTFTSGNNITGWLWNFGDANTSTAQDPCHLYSISGTYIVTLSVTNGLCTDFFTDTIVVPAQPTAAFSFNSPNCINNPVLFTDASFSSINYWNWNFGDAGTSLNQNPTHSYSNAGTDTVTLIVHDIYGCYDTTQQIITIVAPSISGNISAFPDTIVCAGTNVLLVAPACGTCTYLWSNGATNDSITVNTTGVYAVSITDANGCPYTTFITILVNNGPPAIITNSGDDELCFGEFTNLSTTYNINWLYNWISNDPNANGATANGVTVLPTTPPGTYSYQVTITDTTTGCSDTSLPYMIVVHPLPMAPTIVAVGSSVVCDGDTVMLVASHPDPTVTLQWNTGAVNDTILVTKNGCYYATAMDTNGCASQASFCVTVNPLPDLCSFYEGCFDTCAPYTICAPAGSSWQWLNNGLPLPGDTMQCLTTSTSGSYSVIVTNSYGCVDTTGVLNLTLYPCPDSLCADFWIDSVACDSNGNYVMYYHVSNQSQIPVSQANLEILQPNLNVAFAPAVVFTNIPSQGTSSQLSVIIYNGEEGDSLCFRSHILAYDSLGNELICCYSDSDCVVLPPCDKDTTCCYFNLIGDSVWCEASAAGTTLNFQFTVNGCGTLQIQTGQNTSIIGSNPLIMTGNTAVINGIYTPSSPTDTIICITFVMGNGVIYCADTTICITFHCDSVPPRPVCDLHFEDSICVGQTTSFNYAGNPAGLTFNWQFPGGTPSIAIGPGPHYVTYNAVGCYQVICIVTNNLQTTLDCIDTICVIPPPVATIQQNGNSLFAFAAGYSYQWYNGFPGGNPINGAVNQFYNPPSGGFYCVIVSNGVNCADTACIDAVNVGIDELTEEDWNIFPNPNEGAFSLRIISRSNETVELKVMNTIGEVVDRRIYETHSGEQNFYIANQNFAGGVYFIQLKTEKGVGLKRMVVR